MKNLNKKRGLSILSILFLGLLIILVLSFFNINIKQVVESPTSQANLSYVKGEIVSFWSSYLQKPATYVWKAVSKNILPATEENSN